MTTDNEATYPNYKAARASHGLNDLYESDPLDTNKPPSLVFPGVVFAVTMISSFVFNLGVMPMILCDMWQWFIAAPLGVALLSHWNAFGLLVFVNTITYIAKTKDFTKKIENKATVKAQEAFATREGAIDYFYTFAKNVFVYIFALVVTWGTCYLISLGV